jgi:DNA-binding transcriptional LysR family regulator
MDMRPSDLPLLVSLVALLEESNVTHAAERLHVSQPALSAQLARLRSLFDDPLLVPSESGRGMIPTARAAALKIPLQQALRHLVDTIGDPAAFDPHTAERTFMIAANDNAVTMFGVELVRRMEQGGGAGLRMGFCDPAIDNTVARMERGEIDLLLATARIIPPSLQSVALCKEQYHVAQRKGHPRGLRPPTLKQYCSLGHVLVSGKGEFSGLLDERLAALGQSRRVAVVVPHYNLAPTILANTDYLCTLPIRFLQRFADQLDIFALPFELPEFSISMAWHARSDNDPGHRWLREQLQTLATRGGTAPD